MIRLVSCGCVGVGWFVAQVAASPDAVALSFEGVSLSYAEFDARVNRFARYWFRWVWGRVVGGCCGSSVG